MIPMPPLPDPLPDTIAPSPVWRSAMRAWEAQRGRAIVQIHQDGTAEQKDLLREILGDVKAWIERPSWER